MSLLFPFVTFVLKSAREFRPCRMKVPTGEVIITAMSPAEQVARLREQIERANSYKGNGEGGEGRKL